LLPIVFALCAAVGWGVADFVGAISTRRVGLLATILVGQAVACLSLGLLALTPVPVGRPAPGDVTALAISGVLGAASFAGFYRALQLGPVSLVSPMFSAYAAVAVILAVAFGGEKLASGAIAGIVLTIAGVALVSAGGLDDARPGPRPSSRLRRDGVPYALAAMLCWGVAIYLLGRASEHMGWFLPVVISRTVTFAIVACAAAVVGLRHRPIRPRLATLALPGICGLSDVLAFMAYTRATMGGSVSVPTVASACFPLIVIAGGVLFFHERLRGRQILGTGMTLAGLLILGLSR
jgi:drug/metabolite transporter (DMT)-like permease